MPHRTSHVSAMKSWQPRIVSVSASNGFTTIFRPPFGKIECPPSNIRALNSWSLAPRQSAARLVLLMSALGRKRTFRCWQEWGESGLSELPFSDERNENVRKEIEGEMRCDQDQ